MSGIRFSRLVVVAVVVAALGLLPAAPAFAAPAHGLDAAGFLRGVWSWLAGPLAAAATEVPEERRVRAAAQPIDGGEAGAETVWLGGADEATFRRAKGDDTAHLDPDG
jgi:hypothetical protein